MATYSKNQLQYSSSGKAILVTTTASPGDSIHACPNLAPDYDEVWLYASNTDTTDRKLTIQYGGTTSPDDLIEVTVPAESGLTLVVPGLILAGSANRIRAFASAANVINIFGYVNEIRN